MSRIMRRENLARKDVRHAADTDYFPGPLAKSYTPPSVSGGGSTSYAYDKDALLTTVNRPDARTVGFGWNAKSGKLDKTTSSAGTTNLTYDSKYGR